MPYTQTTLSQLQALLRDRYESVPYWVPEEARLALNEGLRIYNAATGFWKTTFQTVTVPNDPYVALPGSLVQGSRVTWNGRPLDFASTFELDNAIPNWRGTTTDTDGAPDRPVYWARISLSLLAIYPADATNGVTGTNSILVDGVRATPILVNPNDYVDLGQEEHNLLLAYAQHVLAFKVGGQVLTASYPGWLNFLKACAMKNNQFAATSFYRKVMGLDIQRFRKPPVTPVESPVAGLPADPLQ